MNPSCSEYARLAVGQRGLIIGVLEAADRLHRCGHDLYCYPRVRVDGFIRSHDPPGDVSPP